MRFQSSRNSPSEGCHRTVATEVESTTSTGYPLHVTYFLRILTNVFSLDPSLCVSSGPDASGAMLGGDEPVCGVADDTVEAMPSAWNRRRLCREMLRPEMALQRFILPSHARRYQAALLLRETTTPRKDEEFVCPLRLPSDFETLV